LIASSVFPRGLISIRLMLAAFALIGAQLMSGAPVRAGVASELDGHASIHMSAAQTLPQDLADPWRPSSLRVLGSVLSGARQIADRARYITCDDESERSAIDRSHVALQSLARLNYCSSIALVQSGSISHLATSVPPPSRRN
jgi:hypothetical protein